MPWPAATSASSAASTALVRGMIPGRHQPAARTTPEAALVVVAGVTLTGDGLSPTNSSRSRSGGRSARVSTSRPSISIVTRCGPGPGRAAERGQLVGGHRGFGAFEASARRGGRLGRPSSVCRRPDRSSSRPRSGPGSPPGPWSPRSSPRVTPRPSASPSFGSVFGPRHRTTRMRMMTRVISRSGPMRGWYSARSAIGVARIRGRHVPGGERGQPRRGRSATGMTSRSAVCVAENDATLLSTRRADLAAAMTSTSRRVAAFPLRETTQMAPFRADPGGQRRGAPRAPRSNRHRAGRRRCRARASPRSGRSSARRSDADRRRRRCRSAATRIPGRIPSLSSSGVV